MESIDQSVKTFFDNPIVLGVVAIFITMYGPRLSPKLPDFVKDAFNNSVFRFIIMVLVIFSGLKDIRLALIISILFIGLMSIVNTQNIKEDYHNQVQEYYANYNLFDKNSNEHFVDFHENYAGASPVVVQPSEIDGNPIQGQGQGKPLEEGKVQVSEPIKVKEQDGDDDEEDEKKSVGITHDSRMEEGNLIEPIQSSSRNNDIANYIRTSVGVLKDMKNFAKKQGSGVSEQCRNAIKIPPKCINEIQSKISEQNLSEITKNEITNKFKWV